MTGMHSFGGLGLLHIVNLFIFISDLISHLLLKINRCKDEVILFNLLLQVSHP